MSDRDWGWGVGVVPPGARIDSNGLPTAAPVVEWHTTRTHAVGCDLNGGSHAVYALSNAHMPGLMKVGRTQNVSRRIADLSRGTGVPEPFRLEWASDCTGYVVAAERWAHHLLAPFRVSTSREFFRVSKECAMTAIIFGASIAVSPENLSYLRASFQEEYVEMDGYPDE